MSKEYTDKQIKNQKDIDGQKVMEKYDTESRYRNLNMQWMIWLVTVLSVGLALFHLITSFTGPFITLQHSALHTGLSMALVFLLYPFRKKSPQQRVSSIDLLLAILSIATIVYIFIDYLGIVQRAGLPNQSDLVLSFLMVMLVLEGGRRDRKSTRLNSSHVAISYAVFCLK